MAGAGWGSRWVWGGAGRGGDPTHRHGLLAGALRPPGAPAPPPPVYPGVADPEAPAKGAAQGARGLRASALGASPPPPPQKSCEQRRGADRHTRPPTRPLHPFPPPHHPRGPSASSAHRPPPRKPEHHQLSAWNPQGTFPPPLRAPPHARPAPSLPHLRANVTLAGPPNTSSRDPRASPS